MTNQLELKPCQCGRMPKLERSDLSGGGLDSPRIRLFCDHTTKWYYEEKYRDGIGGYDDIRAEAMENAIAEWNASADPAAPVADDAVEALAFILAGPQCQDVDDRFAKQVIGELAQKGYTLTRETMTEAELQREAEKIAKDMFEWVDSANAAFIVALAKKYRG
jgi:hypothetical protein